MKIRNKATQIAVGAALSGAALVASAPAYSCASDPFVGSICVTAASFCPYPNYSLAQGQTIAISSNQALFSLIGCTYGGDCKTTFALPDLRGSSPVGIGNAPGMSYGLQALGQKRGTETTTLNVNQMPQHNHEMSGAKTVATSVNTTLGATATAASGSTPLAGGVLAMADRSNVYAASGDDVQMAGPTVDIPQLDVTGSVAPNGGSQPFANFPPQLGVNYCIAVTGVYPSRP